MAITMEELKQKAKAYDEALEKAKRLYEKGTITESLCHIFPELKESDDEKIRKGIIDFLWKEKIFLQEAHSSVENNPKYRFVMDAIAWLEKQGEPKSVYITPVSITDEWIEDYWQHEKVNNPYSHDKGEEIQFDHQGFVRFCKKYCKKPTAYRGV